MRVSDIQPDIRPITSSARITSYRSRLWVAGYGIETLEGFLTSIRRCCLNNLPFGKYLLTKGNIAFDNCWQSPPGICRRVSCCHSSLWD